MRRYLSTGLIMTGLLLLMYVGYAKYTNHQTINMQLRKAEVTLSKHSSISDQTSVPFHEGDTIGILKISSLEIKLPILEGVSDAVLAKGVRHHPDTSLPGEGSRIFIAGHNDTTFSKIGKLKSGDVVELKLARNTYRYEMTKSRIVRFTDTAVRQATASESLVISTCYPFYNITNSTERYLIYFKPVKERKA